MTLTTNTETTPAHPSRFHSLAVAQVVPEIGGKATSIVFDLPPDLTETFGWTAGQHLTLRFDLNGREERRCYTISNPPGEKLRVTAKRVPDGRVSNHLADHLRCGDVVEVMPPFGGFVLEPGPTARRTHYFFGAGSGLTPLYAMLCTVLRDEPHSSAHLILGNRAEDEILFRQDLDALTAEHPDRFTQRHVLSARSLLSWFKPWRLGRVDAAAVHAAIEETPPVAQDVQYWVCGPGTMNGDIRAALMDLDVPSHRIHMESFGGITAQDRAEPGIAATARIMLDGETRDVPVAADQTILDAARAAGLTPPYSCQSGLCGACRARVTQGDTHMRVHMALDEAEIAAGHILACQAVARSETLSIVFPTD